MDGNFKITMKSISEIMKNHNIEKGGKVQKFIDNEVLRRSDPYLPFQTGGLRNSGITASEIGSGEVGYNAPQSRYLYYGKVMIGRAPKKLTNKNLNYHGAPKRGAFWFERMKADHLNSILKGAQKVAEE